MKNNQNFNIFWRSSKACFMKQITAVYTQKQIKNMASHWKTTFVFLELSLLALPRIAIGRVELHEVRHPTRERSIPGSIPRYDWMFHQIFLFPLNLNLPASLQPPLQLCTCILKCSNAMLTLRHVRRQDAGSIAQRKRHLMLVGTREISVFRMSGSWLSHYVTSVENRAENTVFTFFYKNNVKL